MVRGGFFLFILQFSLPLQLRDGAFMVYTIYFFEVLCISIRSEVRGFGDIFSCTYNLLGPQFWGMGVGGDCNFAHTHTI